MPETEPLSRPDLESRGILDYDSLVKLVADRPADLIDRLLAHQGIAILVGNPGIGKTPLVVSIGICVAAGLPVFGHAVDQGPVLYCIGEGSPQQTSTLIKAISDHLGLPSPPADFHIFSPYWGEGSPPAASIPGLVKLARVVKPKLAIVDTLRAFDPTAEKSAEYGAELSKSIREMNAEVGCSTFILHHRRKPSQDYSVSLEADPLGWFNEAVGTNALITQVDSRLGVDKCDKPPAELVLGGFVRGEGAIPPHYLVRRYGANGDPLGYELVSGLDRLSPKQRKVFEGLPNEFTFTDIKTAFGGSSDSNAANLLKLLTEARLAEQVRPAGTYRKKP